MSITWFSTQIIDSNAGQIIKYKSKNWVGIIYKITKNKLSSLLAKQQDFLNHAGIYFLVKQNNSNYSVYVGQSNVKNDNKGVLWRVFQHLNSEKRNDFDYVYIIVDSQSNIGATELNYLEHSFIRLFTDNKNIELLNDNCANKGNISSEDEAEWNVFIENVKTILKNASFDVFGKKQNFDQQKEIQAPKHYKQKHTQSYANDNEVKYYTLRQKSKETEKTTIAYCINKDDKYIVLKGSQIRLHQNEPEYFANLFKTIKEKRDKLILENKIIDGILQENQEFNSKSYAAVFVLGNSSDGRIWVETNNIDYLYEKQSSIDVNNKYKETIFSLSKNSRLDKNKKIIATLKQVEDKRFVLLSGSSIELAEAQHFKEQMKYNSIKELRAECFAKQIIRDGVLQQDLEFKSLSSAAEFVLARSSNGHVDWIKK
ncbi:DUF4357 domain-containing protein [Mycoplasmopsis agalactiae]|nr:DUF4357 domain-containing protein [Mycoplasmopsis agalactiae]MCE6090880.1 DUF4357 domain-containing protein [Mycoplasmopsis agalactiae]